MYLGLNISNFEKDDVPCICLIDTASSFGKCLVQR